MLKNFFSIFNKLPPSNKSMVYLMWIYGIGGIITNTFINIYVFKLHNSLENIIIYNSIFHTACLLGFSGIGLFMSKCKINIKNMYYISYILFILSFIFLFVFHSSLFGVYFFGFICGLGEGTFRCAVHTQELKNITNKNRDFYSSSISAGENIVSVIVPLLVAGLFYISGIYKFDGYLILFLVLPIIYLISFLFIKNIDSYIPKKVTKKDVINFFDLSKYKYGHLYFLFTGFKQGLSSIVIATIGIILLKTEENIGIFNSVLTFISTFAIIHLSHKREDENRLKYYFYITTAMSVLYLTFGIYFGLISYIIFSLLLLFIKPIFRVSEHVYDLSMMDNIKTGENDFYPAMLFREIILWIGRIIGLGTLLVIYYFSGFELNSILRIGLILVGISFLFLYFGAYFWEKNEKHL